MRTFFHRLVVVLEGILLLLMWAAILRAEDGVIYDAQFWAEAGDATNAEADIQFGGKLSVDAPIVLGREVTNLRLLASISIAALPGTEFNPTNIATFSRSVEPMVGVAWRVGRAKVGKQKVETQLIGSFGFATMSDDEVLDKYLHRYGGGLRFADVTNGAYLEVLYGYNEAAGEFRMGHWMLGFSVPIGFTEDVVVLGGDFTLGGSRDLQRIRTAVSVPGLVKAIRGK